MTEQVLKLYNTVYITEDIIHNKMFMSDATRKGVIKVSSIDDVPDGAAFMFSAHGASPKAIAKAEEKELIVIDGTCPIVKSIQNEVKAEAESGKKIIIIGNRSHAEIVALIGYTDCENVFVVYDEADIDLLPDFTDDEVVYFTQTTLDCSCVDVMIKKLKEKIPHLESNSQNNICSATKERQEVVRRVASLTDLVIVVGSSHSSNAKRLCEIALSAGAKNAVLIDSQNDLDEVVLDGVKTMALTSSASTPENVVQDLTEHLKSKFGIIVEDFEIPKTDG
jgi:4-hydroxy-3-methylbut-2-enyl diphosphate reductase